MIDASLEAVWRDIPKPLRPWFATMIGVGFIAFIFLAVANQALSFWGSMAGGG